jgi:hypothetical protein
MTRAARTLVDIGHMEDVKLNADEKIVRQITDKYLDRAKDQLQYPRAPAELRGYVAALMDMLGCVDLFNRSGGLTFIREAHVAAELGILRTAASVSLVSAKRKRPDFELHFGDRTELYELVEAQTPGRKRGDEYTALAAAGFPTCHWPFEEWATGEQASRSIRAMAKVKAKTAEKLAAKGTPYPEQTRLLIYVNLVDFGAHSKEIEDVFPTAVEPARKWFSSIWVLWKNRAYQV